LPNCRHRRVKSLHAAGVNPMTTAMSHVLIDMRPGERLALGGDVSVELIHKSGRAARLRITAPRDVVIEKNQTSVLSSVPSMQYLPRS
jgi:hypothetical protein